MKNAVLSVKLIRILFSFSLLVVVVSLMSFKSVDQVRADTSVQIPNICITSYGTYSIPSIGGEIMISISVPASYVNTVFGNPDSYMANINSLLASKDDADVCVTSISCVDYNTGYMTLEFGPNMFDYDQTIGVVGSSGGYISVIQVAE